MADDTPVTRENLSNVIADAIRGEREKAAAAAAPAGPPDRREVQRQALQARADAGRASPTELIQLGLLGNRRPGNGRQYAPGSPLNPAPGSAA